ncbi:MAG: hypothetical protein WBD36_04615 [Bacteroidota bacterium]
MSNQHEFLQLQTNQIANLTFKFPTGLKKEGRFGPYYLYTVSHEGHEKILKVTEKLEAKLRKLNISVGQTIGLVKETIHPQKGEPFTVFNIVDPTVRPPAPAKPALSSPLPSVVPNRGVNFSGDKQIMYQSIIDAVDITKAIGGIDWRNNDIEKIGVSLFLCRTGHLKPELILANGNGNEKQERVPF